MSPDTNKNEQNQTTKTENRVDPSAKQNETEISTETELSNRVDFPKTRNGSGEESLHSNQVDPKIITENQTETKISKPQNKPIENNNLDGIETKLKPTLNELAQIEATELFEKNKNNPCFLCKNFVESIFKNRKGRKASQAKNCKKCDHAVKGKPNFYK